MKEVRRKAAIEKEEMKEKKRIEFERLLKQERFLDIAKISKQFPLAHHHLSHRFNSSRPAQHGKKFDASGDYGNLADKVPSCRYKYFSHGSCENNTFDPLSIRSFSAAHVKITPS
jgi:hypothetical protein